MPLGSALAGVVARVLWAFALLALVGVWIALLTGYALLGLGQEHLYNDAITLALLAIGSFLDALWHAKSKVLSEAQPSEDRTS